MSSWANDWRAWVRILNTKIIIGYSADAKEVHRTLISYFARPRATSCIDSITELYVDISESILGKSQAGIE